MNDLFEPAADGMPIHWSADVHRSKGMLQVAIGPTSLHQVGLNILTIPIHTFARLTSFASLLVSVVSLVPVFSLVLVVPLVSHIRAYPITHILFFFLRCHQRQSDKNFVYLFWSDRLRPTSTTCFLKKEDFCSNSQKNSFPSHLFCYFHLYGRFSLSPLWLNVLPRGLLTKLRRQHIQTNNSDNKRISGTASTSALAEFQLSPCGTLANFSVWSLRNLLQLERLISVWSKDNCYVCYCI